MNAHKLDTISVIYTDNEYVLGLKNGDGTITRSFFYTLCCFTLNDIKWSLGLIDYDELVNELYIYLSEHDWHKLDTFEGKNGCSLKSWMARLSWRFFMQQRGRLMNPNSCNYESSGLPLISDDQLDREIAMDVDTTFNRMANKRYVQVLKWMLADGYDANEVAAFLHTHVSNVYNIKHRAIVQFIETYNS